MMPDDKAVAEHGEPDSDELAVRRQQVEQLTKVRDALGQSLDNYKKAEAFLSDMGIKLLRNYDGEFDGVDFSEFRAFKDVKRLEKECSELRDRLAWKPMETAPKDVVVELKTCEGLPILGYQLTHAMRNLSWMHIEGDSYIGDQHLVAWRPWDDSEQEGQGDV